MKKVVISGTGQDRPGIVAAVTGVLYDGKCNIEDTSMTRLEDHFALLMIVFLPATLTVARLEERLVLATEPLGFRIHLDAIETVRGTAPERGKTWLISVTGQDQTGIMFHVTRALAALDVNIQTLSSKQLTREQGETLFLMSLEVEVPTTTVDSRVQDSLQKVAREEHLEIHAEPLEEFTL